MSPSLAKNHPSYSSTSCLYTGPVPLLSGEALADETTLVEQLLEAAKPFDTMKASIQTRAQELVITMREGGSGSGVEAFLHEYGLNNKEGVAVMCLAEALLRIPDAKTADKLIQNTFSDSDWEKHLGQSDSLFVNASSWGLMLTGKVVNMGGLSGEKPAGLVKGLINKCGEPVIRESLKRAMHIIGTQFVMGEDIADATGRAGSWEKKGYRFSYDILGEGARNQQQADAYYNAYLQAIDVVGKGVRPTNNPHDMRGISVKLSGLHPRYHLLQEDRLVAELLPRLKTLVAKTMANHITLSIDAEEANRLDVGLAVFAEVFTDPDFKDYNGLGYVLQAYQKRAYTVVGTLAALARQTGKKMPLRLVKGAYWDSEIKYAQMNGLPGYPVFTRKEHTDVSYLACAARIFEHDDAFYPQFATHNALTVASIMALAKGRAFEFQRLHGMGEKLHAQVVNEIPCRIYAPVGKHEDLLAYLIRRLLENGANTSFVNLLMDKRKPIPEVLDDPLARTRLNQAQPNPRIPLPADLYGADRQNSQGVELGYRDAQAAWQVDLSRYANTVWLAKPMIVGSAAPSSRKDLFQPAELSRKVGMVEEATETQVKLAMDAAQRAFHGWNGLPVGERAGKLENMAVVLEENRAELIALLMREAGKTFYDAVAEVREAADFCRYYAARARESMTQATRLTGPTGEKNTLQLSGRGVFVCISPWNFPLAIFLGQVAAALVTGNTVVAKPADQTPLIAARAVDMLHEAGIPLDVIQLLPGNGKDVGEALVKHPHTAGVVFTGSTATARRINQTLAQKDGPIVPLIAETGGQNGMIIDSSALLEQACDDVLTSAFGSAGQRCSALRVLFVQEDVADKFLTLLTGAMQEIRVGNPEDLRFDLGPVIDKAAWERLRKHLAYLEEIGAKKVASVPLEHAENGHYFAPVAYEIKAISQLPGEVFGPVLHVIRFPASGLDQVVNAINSTGFGLTFGVQSRIDSTIQQVTKRVEAGNIYVNRSMIGATVGVQPFGGEGLSGTGPKAGGPHYLLRFVTERTVTVNTAAIGGNLELLL